MDTREANLDKSVVVSRHPAAWEFIAKSLFGLDGRVDPEGKFLGAAQRDYRIDLPDDYYHWWRKLPILSGNVTPDDVRGKVVFGNIPLDLASYAEAVCPILFHNSPPRGQEYTLEYMEKAGAYLGRFCVLELRGEETKNGHLSMLVEAGVTSR